MVGRTIKPGKYCDPAGCHSSRISAKIRAEFAESAGLKIADRYNAHKAGGFVAEEAMIFHLDD